MLNLFGQKKDGNGKKKFTDRKLYDIGCFYLRPEAWEHIKAIKGWPKNGAISRLAEALKPQCTRQYASMIVNRRVGCSAWVMREIIRLVNIQEGEAWCHLFSLGLPLNIDPNHPQLAMRKYYGEVPYSKYSTAKDFRRQSYGVE